MKTHLLFSFFIAFIISVGFSEAATFTVTDPGDTGQNPWDWGSYAAAPKTLRNALHFAGADYETTGVKSTINLNVPGNTITIMARDAALPYATGQLTIQSDVTINGNLHTIELENGGASADDNVNNKAFAIASYVPNRSPENTEINDLTIRGFYQGISIGGAGTDPGSVENNITIDNVTIEDSYDKGIYAENSLNLTLTDITVNNTGFNGIQLNGGSANLINPTIDGTGLTNPSSDPNNHGILLENGDFNIDGGTVTNVGYGNGIKLQGVLSGIIDGVNVTGNNQDGLNSTSSSNISIINSFFNGNGLVPGPNGEARGIYIGEGSNIILDGNQILDNFHSGLLLNSSNNNTIVNNIVSNNGLVGTGYHHGISMDNSSNNTIEKNTIEDNLRNGIEFNFGSNDNELILNQINNNGSPLTTTPGAGVQIQSGSSNLIAYGNTITGSDKGIQVNPSANTPPPPRPVGPNEISNLQIDSNTVTGNTIGIQLLNDIGTVQDLYIEKNDVSDNNEDGIQVLSSLNGVQIINNEVSSNGVSGTGYGLNISPASSTNNQSLIESNNITNNASGGMVINQVNSLAIGGTGLGSTGENKYNIINDNGGNGISVVGGDSISVNYNFIGVSDDGTTVLANSGSGIDVDGTTRLSVKDAFIYGNDNHGIYLAGGTTLDSLVRNKIGSDGGTTAYANGGFGIQVQGATGTIGGDDILDKNIIAGNTGGGILVDGATSQLNVQFNEIGDPDFANPASGITVNAGEHTFFGNLVENYDENGIQLIGGKSTVDSSVVQNNGINGIYVEGDNNHIGSSGNPNTITGNTEQGISLTNGASYNEIDGNLIFNNQLNGINLTTAGRGNKIGNQSKNSIYSNTEHGIYIDDTPGTDIKNNFIGTDSTGLIANGNGLSGIYVTNLSEDSTSTLENNLISANSENGISLSNNPATTQALQILNNNIGLDSDDAALGNAGNGIDFDNTDSVLVRGNDIAYNGTGTTGEGVNISDSDNNIFDGNTIGGNLSNGAYITGTSSDNRFTNNYIGLDDAGNDFTNGIDKAGIHVNSGTANIIGEAGSANYFGGADQDYSVYVDGGTETEINNNVFGTHDVTVGTDLKTKENAIRVAGGSVDYIQENVFQYNGLDAVVINNATADSIKSNYFGVQSDGQTDLSGKPGTAIILENGANSSNVVGNIIPGTSTADAIIVRGVSTDNNSIKSNLIGLYGDETIASETVKENGILLDALLNPNLTIEENVIGNVEEDGIKFQDVDNTGSTTTSIKGNSVGVNNGGNDISGSTQSGISLLNSDAITLDSNIAGFNNIGIELEGSSYNVIINNQLGAISSDSTGNKGNATGIAILASSDNNKIGDESLGEGNLIAFSSTEGISVDNSTGNDIVHNSMYCNAGGNTTVGGGTPQAQGTGITLANGGNATSSGTQDFMSPLFSSFQPYVVNNSGSYTLELREDSLSDNGFTEVLSSTNHRIDVYETDDDCENCQGKTHIGEMTINGTGTATLTLGSNPKTYVVTITRTASNNTSQFSGCSYSSPCTPPTDLVISEQFQGVEDTVAYCFGTQDADLYGTAFTGGTPETATDNNYYYAWYRKTSTGKVDLNNGSRDSLVVFPTADSTYLVLRSYSKEDGGGIDEFKDVEGCYIEDSILVVAHELPEFTFTQNATICYEDSATLTVSLDQGTEPYTFIWQDDQSLGSTNGSSSATDTSWILRPEPIDPTVQTIVTYSLTSLIDSNGCEATATELASEEVEVTVNPLPSAVIANISDADICYNTTTDLTINYIDGTAPFDLTYFYSNGDTLTIPDNQTNPFTTQPLTQDTVFNLFIVEDANSCRDTIVGESQSITVYPEISGTLFDDNTVCVGEFDSVLFVFDGVLTGTAASFQFEYTINGGAPIMETSTNDSVTVIVNTSSDDSFIYEIVSITADNGCTADPANFTGSITKTINPLPEPAITGELAPCFNTTQTYTVTTPINGNVYNWSIITPPAGIAGFTGTSANTQSVELEYFDNATFTLRLYEQAGQCIDSVDAVISVVDTINFGFSLAEVCNEVDDYQFDATNVTFSPSPTLNGSSYTLGTEQYFLEDSTTEVTASGINPKANFWTSDTLVYLRMTSQTGDGGCVSVASAPLTINETPQNVSISPEDTLICETATVTLEGSADINSGTITDTYKGTGVSGDVFDATAAGVGATNTVWYIATSNKGCKDSVSTTVNTTPPLAPDFTASQDDPVCEDEPQTFIATKNNNNFGTNPVYEWRLTSPNNPIITATGSPVDIKVNSGNTVYLTVRPGSDAPSCLVPPDFVNIPVVATTIKRPDITDVSVIPVTKTKYCIGSSIDLASNVISGTINDLSTEYDWIKVNQNNGDTTVLLSGSTQTNITDTGDEEGTFTYTLYVTNIKGTGSCSSSLASGSVQIVVPEVVAYAGNTQGKLVTQNAFALQNETIYLDADHPNQATNYGNYEWTLVSIENSIVNEFVDDQKSTTNIPEVMEEDKNVLYQVSTERTDVDPGCIATDTVSVRLRATCFVPNGFTPNDDGQNDTWNIACLNDGDYPNAVVKIFNRWGELVYKDEQGYRVPWDGTRNGKLVPIGTYYFAIDLNDGYEQIAGAVGIIR